MNPRRDRADRGQISGVRATPMRLAHLACSVSTIAIYSVAPMCAAKNFFAPF
jgi:hypothetical protein